MHAHDAEIMISQKLFLSPWAIEIKLRIEAPAIPTPSPREGERKASNQ